MTTSRKPFVCPWPSFYDRNNLMAPTAQIISERRCLRTWGDFAFGHATVNRLRAECLERGEKVFSVWLNPGPDFVGVDRAPVFQAAE